MDIQKRLFRKPFTTVLWLIIVILMTGFLTVGVTLNFSSAQLAKSLDKSHTAIAVRTDPAAEEQDGEFVVSRRFTRGDAEWFESQDTVKAVRNHTLNAGSSPSFHPITGTDKNMSWYSPGTILPYYNAVFAGRVYYTELYDDGSLIIGADTVGILLLNGELEQAEQLLEYIGYFIVEMDASEIPEAKELFELGETYVFSGIFDPRGIRYDPRHQRAARGYSAYVLDLGSVRMEDGVLMGANKLMLGGDGSLPEAYSYPAAEKCSGPAETFFEDTPNDIWREYRAAWERQNHSLPVIGTDRLESLFVFVHGDAEVTDGRSFTPEEYESGARVMLISESEALKTGLEVGSKVMMCQYPCEGDSELITNPSAASFKGSPLMNPNVDLLSMSVSPSPEEEFEIVGIYTLSADWSYGTYSITPNTVFIPRAAQSGGAFGAIPGRDADPDKTEDVYGLYLSIELNNGSVDDFRLALSDSPYAGQFYTFDQGYEAVQKNLNGLARTSSRLMWIAAAGWVLFLLLFLLMYQAGQRRELGVIRSLGKEPYRAAFYLAGSGLIVACAGVILGTLIGHIVLGRVQAGILESAIRGVDAAAGQAALSEEALGEMISASIPGADVLALMGLVQLGIMAVFIIVQAALLARKNPRELMAR